MNLTLLATGSRGDVQPFVALGYALEQAGHQVTFVSNAIFADWINSYGLDFRPISWDPVESMRRQPEVEGLDPVRLAAAVRQIRANNRRVILQAQAESLAACRHACQDARLLVYCAIAPWGQTIAEKLGIPSIAGFLHPMLPTRAFPMQMIPTPLGGPLNLASHYLGDWAMDLMITGLVNEFRRSIGLAEIRFPNSLSAIIRSGEAPVLLALSPTVIPRPPDWPVRARMDGYWFLPPAPGWAPPQYLVDFLSCGPAPVYIGFGSMSGRDPGEVLRIAREALRQTGLRGILAAGWSGLQPGKQADNLLVIDEAPHEWLFPRMRAVVHHGGAGTTAAGLRAGVPAVIIPHMQDQFYWANRLHALGVAARPLPRRELAVENLADRFREVQSEAICQAAQRIGERVCSEPGARAMVQVIEEYAASLGQ